MAQEFKQGDQVATGNPTPIALGPNPEESTALPASSVSVAQQSEIGIRNTLSVLHAFQKFESYY